MEKLFDVLTRFVNEVDSNIRVEKLEERFKNDLAPAFLYGGYIKVRNDFRIYIEKVYEKYKKAPDNVYISDF